MRKLAQKRCARALAFATQKHDGQMRIGGDAYITHPVAVAQTVRDWGYPAAYQIAALFHDLLEDTDASEREIRAIGGRRVLRAVKMLTKTPGYDMKTYVGRIQKCRMARVVKAADRLHNLRCAVVAPEAFRRRYVEESTQWYLDFAPEIVTAIRELAETLGEGEE